MDWFLDLVYPLQDNIRTFIHIHQVPIEGMEGGSGVGGEKKAKWKKRDHKAI